MNKSQTIFVTGLRGSGKTHLIKTEIIPQFHPIIIFDTNHEFDDLPGFSVPKTKADLLDLIEIGDNIRVPYDEGISLEDVCFILNHVKKQYTIVIDEFHVLYRHHGNFEAKVPTFRTLIMLGNHNNVSAVIAAQRPIHVPKDVLSQCTTLYSFHMFHKKDIEWISDIVEEPEDFRKLGLYEYKKIVYSSPIEVTTGKTSL